MLINQTLSSKYFRWNIQMPTIIKGSISILSDAGLGMAMFSLGTTALTFCCLFITNSVPFPFSFAPRKC
ncbi:unnamed protein product [Triticum turgidum subsp. durum]|uniref:Uncharacterized protein n=1 Tax=Triticum turgidum subsp. durum TaxID=4567 RepID=A0A9R0ZMB2_TRITD|nr:unnamed protein product [Triticum turgidum subsp. durum]